MVTQNVVLMLVGIGFLVVGYVLITNEKLSGWFLRSGRARIWINLLGEERAQKVTKVFFGPLCIVLGALVILISVLALTGH